MADITVFGAGIFGLSIAWVCTRRGAKVSVVDPNGIGAGASGGVVGALAPHTPENWNAKKQQQFESLVAAEAFWKEVEHTAGVVSGYGRIGRLQPIHDAHGLSFAKARQEQAMSLWKGLFEWRVVPQSEYAGLLSSRTGFLISDTLSARLHPRRATWALAAALKRHGVEVLTEPSGTSGREIWATGASGLLALSQVLGYAVGNGVKGQAALLACDLAGAPQIYADGLHIVPHADGTTAVGSTSERDFAEATQTDALLDEVVERARAVCPQLADAPIVERWAGLRPRARSRAPMLGAHPTKPGAFIANGGFKIGFGMAPSIATMMADLVLDGRDTIPDLFRPEASLPRTPG
jgi:glycine oxidase